MKKWKRLLAIVAIASGLGVAVTTQTAFADVDSSSIDSADTVTELTYGENKSVDPGDTVIWHAVFTPGNAATDMSDLRFSDPLDKQLEYVSAKVLQVLEVDSAGNPNSFGKDITSTGTLSFDKSTNTVSWIPKTPTDLSFAGNNDNSTIDLVIKAKVSDDATNGEIPNIATMTLGGQSYKTNEPTLTVKTPISSKIDKTVKKLAKTGVKLGQAHPVIAALIALCLIGGLGFGGYRIWKKRSAIK